MKNRSLHSACSLVTLTDERVRGMKRRTLHSDYSSHAIFILGRAAMMVAKYSIVIRIDLNLKESRKLTIRLVSFNMESTIGKKTIVRIEFKSKNDFCLARTKNSPGNQSTIKSYPNKTCQLIWIFSWKWTDRRRTAKGPKGSAHSTSAPFIDFQ